MTPITSLALWSHGSCQAPALMCGPHGTALGREYKGRRCNAAGARPPPQGGGWCGFLGPSGGLTRAPHPPRDLLILMSTSGAGSKSLGCTDAPLIFYQVACALDFQAVHLTRWALSRCPPLHHRGCVRSCTGTVSQALGPPHSGELVTKRNTFHALVACVGVHKASQRGRGLGIAHAPCMHCASAPCAHDRPLVSPAGMGLLCGPPWCACLQHHAAKTLMTARMQGCVHAWM